MSTNPKNIRLSFYRALLALFEDIGFQDGKEHHFNPILAQKVLELYEKAQVSLKDVTLENLQLWHSWAVITAVVEAHVQYRWYNKTSEICACLFKDVHCQTFGRRGRPTGDKSKATKLLRKWQSHGGLDNHLLIYLKELHEFGKEAEITVVTNNPELFKLFLKRPGQFSDFSLPHDPDMVLVGPNDGVWTG